MNIKFNIRKFAELGIGFTAITVLLLAGCGGGGGSSAGGSTGGGGSVVTTTMAITPALGLVYKGRVTVRDRANRSKSYDIASASGVNGVITADITGMTAPLLVTLTGDASGQLQYFDEAKQTTITNTLASSAVPALRAIVPSTNGLTPAGVGVTPLTEIAAATVADASNNIDVATLSVASAVGANTAGLALAQKISGSTTINDVLAPPTPVNSASTDISGTATGNVYAQVLSALAALPSGTYGNDALAKAKALSAAINTNSVLPATFNVDLAQAATAALTNNTNPNGTFTLVPAAAINADFKAVMKIGTAAAGMATTVADQQAAQQAIMAAAFNAAAGNTVVVNVASAVAAAPKQVTDAAAAAAPIKTAKDLMTSLRTNVNLLGNSGNAGFVQNQASAVQTDLSNNNGPLNETQNFVSFLSKGVNLLQNNASITANTAYWVSDANGNSFPCGVNTTKPASGNGGAACQWINYNGTPTTHQLLISGPVNTTSGTYTWSETIISISDTGYGETITLPTVSNTSLATAKTGSATFTSTLAFDAVNGNPTSGTGTLVVLGNSLPGQMPSTNNGYNHYDLTATLSASTNLTMGLVGTVSKYNNASTPVVVSSIDFGTGSNVVVVSGNSGHPVSTHMVVAFTSQNYKFDGTLDVTSFAPDKTTMCTWWDSVNLTWLSTPVCGASPNWYPVKTTFTGSVTNLASASVGKIMTGTLTMNMDHSAYNSNSPQTASNYPKNYGSFVGTIINGTSTYSISFSTTLPVCTFTACSYDTTLVYTDPKPTTVSVSWTDTQNYTGPYIYWTVTSNQKATLGAITMLKDSNNTPTLYSGYVSSSNKGTVIGTVSGNMMSFIDGTTQSIQ